MKVSTLDRLPEYAAAVEQLNEDTWPEFHLEAGTGEYVETNVWFFHACRS